jgi:hypothetical protein
MSFPASVEGDINDSFPASVEGDINNSFAASVELDIKYITGRWIIYFKPIYEAGKWPKVTYDNVYDEMVRIKKATRSSDYIKEENLVQLMHLRDNIHTSWNTIPTDEKKRIVHQYDRMGDMLNNIISRMQLHVLLEKLKEWCT